MGLYLYYYVITIILILTASYLLTRSTNLECYFEKTGNFLKQRGLFYPKNYLLDEKIVNLVRFFSGLIILYRIYQIYQFTLPLGFTLEQILHITGYTILALSVTLGFLTPLAVLSLLILQLQFNVPFETYSLGVDVTAMILVGLLIYPAGRMYSLDAWLSQRVKVIDTIYTWFTWQNREAQTAIAKLIPFLFYGYLCVYSVLVHLNDPSWTSGDASIYLLSSTYLSRWPYEFQWLFSQSDIAVLLARYTMYITIGWYFFLVPAVLVGGWARYIAEIWTILFLILSIFVLQLSTLPYHEVLLVFFWFWNLWLEKYQSQIQKTINVLFDDRCNLCDKTVYVLKALDLFERINFLPVSKNLNLSNKIGVAPEELYTNIYSWDTKDEKIYYGFDFYLHVSRRLVLLYPIYPILAILKFIKIGPLVYSIVAKYRYRMFGVCERSSINLNNHNFSVPNDKNAGLLSKSFAITCIIFLIMAMVHLPGIKSPIRNPVIDARFNESHHIMGLAPIDVFNKRDLELSYHYFTASKSGKLMPYTTALGMRDSWHHSDKVYFGNSLRWRRAHISEPIYPFTELDKRYFCQVASWSNYYYPDDKNIVTLDFYSVEAPKKNNGLYIFDSPNKTLSLQVDEGFCQNNVTKS